MTTNNSSNWSSVRSTGSIMKTKTMRIKTLSCLSIAFACFMYMGSANAQVTIGSGIEPEKGAILELKEFSSNANNATSTKGIVYPRVELSDKNELYPMHWNSATGTETADYAANRNALKKSHIGLTVFNVTETGHFTSGVHTWTGSEWRKIDDSPVIQPSISSMLCNSAQMSPNSYKKNVAFQGILKVPYLGGNGGSYPGTTPVSIGNGLFLERTGGKLAYGPGEVTYLISGTPTVSSPTTTTIHASNFSFLGFSCGQDVTVGNGVTGLNLKNLESDVIINTLRQNSGISSDADILPFGTIEINETGSYAFSIRLYGSMMDANFQAGRAPFYIYLMKNDRNTLIDAAEIDVVVVSQELQYQDYSYSVTLGGSYEAGEKVIIAMHRPHFSRWNLKKGLTTTSPIRTSLIYWKL